MKKIFFFLLAVIAFVILFLVATPKQSETVGTPTASYTDEAATKNAICSYFETNGWKIKRATHQPLIEKDPGLYSGQERWWITFEDGEQIVSWVKDGKITFCHGGNEHSEIPLY